MRRWFTLARGNKVPAIKDATLGRARVIKQGCRYLIVLIAKIKVFTLLEGKTLKKARFAHYMTSLELNLQTISISKMDVDNVFWATIEKFQPELFYDSATKRIVYNNYITIPETSDRNKIIAENHALFITGHKSITKTYQGICHNYFWSDMKLEIQKYIQKCQNCQFKKLVRIKTW